jgi:hypothetical protein
VDAKLNNAVAATATGPFLCRLRKEGRNPDPWEAEQTVRAMAFLPKIRSDSIHDGVRRGWALQ